MACSNSETTVTFSLNLLTAGFGNRQIAKSEVFSFPGRKHKFYVEIEKNYFSCYLLYLVNPAKVELNLNVDITYQSNSRKNISTEENLEVYLERHYLTKLLNASGKVTFKFTIIQQSKLQGYDVNELQRKDNVEVLPRENSDLLKTCNKSQETKRNVNENIDEPQLKDYVKVIDLLKTCNKSQDTKRNVNEKNDEPQFKDNVKGLPRENAFLLKTCNKSLKETKRNVNEEKDIALLSDDLKNAFLNEEDSDVILKVGDKSYPAHKVIIRNRSPVFRSMLEHDMTEKKEGIVTIEDCDPVIFRDFLLYLYTGKLDDLSTENAFDLYYMSDKYNVCQLKLNCADFLLQNLSIDNVCDVINLALKHCERDLFDHAVQFFIENAQDVFITVKWQKFLMANPTQANELIIKAFKNKSGK